MFPTSTFILTPNPTHIYTHIHTQTHTHTQTHAHTHTNTHTHTHIRTRRVPVARELLPQTLKEPMRLEPWWGVACVNIGEHKTSLDGHRAGARVHLGHTQGPLVLFAWFNFKAKP